MKSSAGQGRCCFKELIVEQLLLVECKSYMYIDSILKLPNFGFEVVEHGCSPCTLHFLL